MEEREDWSRGCFSIREDSGAPLLRLEIVGTQRGPAEPGILWTLRTVQSWRGQPRQL
jgi:hypothetical protein